MYTVNRLHHTDLTPQDKEILQSLTTHPFVPLLHTPLTEGGDDVLLFSAVAENTPVALLVSSYNTPMKTAQIHTIFVSEAHRNKKIAQNLLQKLDDELRKRHCRLTIKRYDPACQTSTHLEKALGRTGWQGTKLFSKRFWLEHELFSPEWMKKEYNLPAQMTFFPWSDLKDTERAILLTSWKSWQIPSVASPFWDEEHIVKEGSYGIRGRKGVIAWMITHAETSEIRRYSTFYVHPEYRNTTVGIKILAAAIQYGIDHHIKWGVFDLHIQNTDRAWMKFVETRLQPYAHHTEQIRQAWHLY